MSAPDPAAAELERLHAIEAAATEGPWEPVTDDHGRGHLDYSVWSDQASYYIAETVISRADANFIAEARTAFPRLLAAVEAVLKLADEWRAVGSPESAEEEALMWQRIESGEALRDAVARELTRKEARDAGT